jgi:hypothetical protein
MRQPATGITQNLGNRNRKKDRTAVRFSSVLWIFSVHRTEPANTTNKTTPVTTTERPHIHGPPTSIQNPRPVQTWRAGNERRHRSSFVVIVSLDTSPRRSCGHDTTARHDMTRPGHGDQDASEMTQHHDMATTVTHTMTTHKPTMPNPTPSLLSNMRTRCHITNGAVATNPTHNNRVQC